MRVTAKSDYALRALIEIARRSDGVPVSAEEIGRLQDIPHGFLQAILADLRRAGILVAQRGQSGGWRMNRDPDDVTVADVIRAVDGPLVSIYGLRPEAVTTVTFLTLAFAQLWHVFDMRDRSSHPLRNQITANPWVWIALAVCSILLIIPGYLPPLTAVMGLVTPDAGMWTIVLTMSLAPLVLVQLSTLVLARSKGATA